MKRIVRLEIDLEYLRELMCAVDRLKIVRGEIQQEPKPLWCAYFWGSTPIACRIGGKPYQCTLQLWNDEGTKIVLQYWENRGFMEPALFFVCDITTDKQTVAIHAYDDFGQLALVDLQIAAEVLRKESSQISPQATGTKE